MDPPVDLEVESLLEPKLTLCCFPLFCLNLSQWLLPSWLDRGKENHFNGSYLGVPGSKDGDLA